MPKKPSPARLLTRLLDAAATPVYVVDKQRRLVWGNASFAAWTGRSVEEITGLKLSYCSGGELAGAVELASALCPPPEAFDGSLTLGVVSAPGPDGQFVTREAQFAWLAGEGDVSEGL